jgi:hypothetical protein
MELVYLVSATTKCYYSYVFTAEFDLWVRLSGTRREECRRFSNFRHTLQLPSARLSLRVWGFFSNQLNPRPRITSSQYYLVAKNSSIISCPKHGVAKTFFIAPFHVPQASKGEMFQLPLVLAHVVALYWIASCSSVGPTTAAFPTQLPSP